MVQAPGSPSSLRTANRRRVLDVLRRLAVDDDAVADGSASAEDAPVPPTAFSQASLARETGLAPATVSNIVRDLTAAGVLETLAGGGRRGSVVRLSPTAGYVAGVDFGHEHVAVAVGDLSGRLLVSERVALAPEPDHGRALAAARSTLEALLGQVPQAPLRHVTLGLAAPIQGQSVGSANIFPGWEGVDALAAARAAFSVPVTLENDANLGALAEHRLGVARGLHSSFFVKISHGVGGGLIVADQLFRGASGSAGEIGHLTLDEQGPLCRCGSRGCLEAYASIQTVQQMMAGQLPDAGFPQIVSAAEEGSVAARRAIEDAGLHLGWALASIVNLFNPAIVVIGGRMGQAGELVLESARIGLRRHALDAVALTPVAVGSLGERASLLGSLLVAAEQVDLAEVV
ncbi:ROK family transcriptional regulator [Nocardioides bruguierae]|uniref:ROK family transcriptional regulator n=1 Tax=Nocardioides bruguierae TaxID=2945102 RepID=A0A9X2D8Q3_9ACTN|nr:ROK family transcriptional regulator [Nocardioides bruguierae]MCL8025161.1 ROK family transcriptional regulator [Nocardioides bruguierae]MCM0621215.1 ROK family transcriptional regulator [Nocardioides bruguierae]